MIPSKILIFDGECAFCNRSVLFILDHNTNEDIYVCSSQSVKGQEVISAFDIKADPSKTLIYIENDQHYIKSNAALKIARSLSFRYRLLLVFKIIPRFIRDWVYDGISERRKKIIANKNSCSFELAQRYSARVLA